MDALISSTLNSRPLEYTPGAHYDYSNFGYCLLGRIIEKITGQTYEEAVKTLVLAPMGITSMKIGGNTLADRLPKEVRYYGQSGEDPYIHNIRRMDAHGGWVASAKDLARFLVYVDGFPVRPDILSSQALTTMITPSAANNGYACGWAVTTVEHLISLIESDAEVDIIKSFFQWKSLYQKAADEVIHIVHLQGRVSSGPQK